MSNVRSFLNLTENKIGITDGMFTEVDDPALPVGTKVVTDENETDKDKKKK